MCEHDHSMCEHDIGHGVKLGLGSAEQLDILLMTEPDELKSCYPDHMSNELWANGISELIRYLVFLNAHLNSI